MYIEKSEIRHLLDGVNGVIESLNNLDHFQLALIAHAVDTCQTSLWHIGKSLSDLRESMSRVSKQLEDIVHDSE